MTYVSTEPCHYGMFPISDELSIKLHTEGLCEIIAELAREPNHRFPCVPSDYDNPVEL